MQLRILLCTAAILCIALLGTASSNAASLTATVIQTDTSDYAPGDSVIITGSGYWPNEYVSILIKNVYNPGVGEINNSWTVRADSQGKFRTFWIVPNEAVDQTFRVTAT